MDKGNAVAFYHLGGAYANGDMGLPQDYQKAIELYLKGGELGSARAFCNLGLSYDKGTGVEVDTKKAQHYYELASMMGDEEARYNLGFKEAEKGNGHQALKHWKIAARAGHDKSLDIVKQGYIDRVFTKDEYTNTLRAYHERHKETRSDARDKADLLVSLTRHSH